ncbi:Uncharacterised protein [Escherichia coli]|nr:Uncharacterised protein [Escherichia coli]
MRDKIASCKTFLPFNAFLSTEGIVLNIHPEQRLTICCQRWTGVNNTPKYFSLLGFTNKQWRCNDE